MRREKKSKDQLTSRKSNPFTLKNYAEVHYYLKANILSYSFFRIILFWFQYLCSDKRIMIGIMTSTRLGVPMYSLQVSCVSMKFENFYRRSFHINAVNFVTYDLTCLDLDGRLLKRYNLHFFLNRRFRSHEIHDTAGRRDDTFRVGLFA